MLAIKNMKTSSMFQSAESENIKVAEDTEITMTREIINEEECNEKNSMIKDLNLHLV